MFSVILPARYLRACLSCVKLKNFRSFCYRRYVFEQLFPICNFHTSATFHKKKDYYDVLGVSRNSSQKEIKKAYYQLAKKYHPDTNKDPQAAKKFQEVSEAYEVLSDDARRKQYDQWGTSTDFGAGGPNAGFQGFQSTIDPEELFRKIFGDFGLNMGFQDFAESQFGFGSSKEIIVNLSFQESVRGVNKPVSINVVDTCPKCRGSKSEPGTKSIPCPYCNATGMETLSTGPFVMRTTCRYCLGTRMHNKFPCLECEGKGKTVQKRTVTVPVPAGIEDGQTIRMQVNKEELFITFKVSKSNYFRREGVDIHTDATISLSQAVLGGKIRIQGLYEDVDIKINPGTSSHSCIRLPGKGVKRVNSFGNGDHFVHVKIKIPLKLSDKQKALMTAFAELEDDTPGTVEGIQTKKEDDEKIYAGKEKSHEWDKNSGLLSKIKKAIFG
ncbi:protein tumorous imaginal discs, mitochondrial-like isoform X1 [Centruroides sculpturatus]|uniref:protein tumorous imaginal discs, mitochondrial-like isoform X1 n=1 Tax=Centruroides sculpturatus TaxID=218467 RepID=UPI000C6E36DA|nr:protein tumorous imaginal discs, mitochondrial-like isoform X1 [Centruroides sculpturatus]